MSVLEIRDPSRGCRALAAAGLSEALPIQPGRAARQLKFRECLSRGYPMIVTRTYEIVVDTEPVPEYKVEFIILARPEISTLQLIPQAGAKQPPARLARPRRRCSGGVLVYPTREVLTGEDCKRNCVCTGTVPTKKKYLYRTRLS